MAEKEPESPKSWLTQFDPARRLPWTQGQGYTSDAYPWHLKNDQPLNRLFLNGSEVSSESGTLDMNMAEAWRYARNSDFPVAVIDSLGFDYRHPDLKEIVVHAEKSGGGVPDPHNHGTQVAGLIGNMGNNDFGSVGMCWRVPLMLFHTPNRVNYQEWANSLAWAILRASTLGARVICIPQGVAGLPIVRTALESLGEVLVVCSALNSPTDHDLMSDYPTAWRLPKVLTISNCMRDGQLLPGGAGYGAQTVFAGAPGRRLPVLMAGGGYGFASGTSEAAGVAAGLISLLWSAKRRLNALQLKQRLAAGVLPVPALAGKTITGGMLHSNAFTAWV